MNTPVSFEIAKLLKEKGFDEECRLCVEDGDERPLPFNCGNTLHKNSLHPYYSAPTIGKVVMWLYEKHGIWIQIGVGNLFHKDKFYIILKQHNVDRWDVTPLNNEKHSPYNTPTEAYEAAIEYTLNNLI